MNVPLSENRAESNVPLPANRAESEVTAFALALYRYCRYFGGSVTSWLRTADHNSQVGGLPGSLHLLALGADVVFDSPRLDSDVRHSMASSLGLRLVVESDHDHLQLERFTSSS